MDKEELQITDRHEEERTPPRDEIKIVDMSSVESEPPEKVCKLCGQLKPVYVEAEVDGLIEYTCKECFRKSLGELGKRCRKCGASLMQGNSFCGKCGTPTQVVCGKCGSPMGDDDIFCGKCGSKL